MTHTATLRSRSLAAAIAAALLAAMLGVLPQHLQTFLIPADVPLPAGARVLESFAVADALLVTAPMMPAGAVSADEPLGFRALEGEAPEDGSPWIDSGVAATNAPAVWDTTQGERAVVALVDTGVDPVGPLADAMAGEIDFSGTGGGDGYGHGTYMASLIAARGNLAPGVAPATGVLSLKVADAEGKTDLARVMSALQWLYGPGRAVGIRVVTLALGVDADSPAAALLDLASARLAADGVLVVVAAGNDGDDALSSPATAPGTFSVGAVNDAGEVAEFSATGVDRLGVAQPDIYAPGVGIVGWMDPEAHIATENPQASDGLPEGLIRGSGTSMATALTAGVAALVSSARPDLDVEGLDAALRAGNGRVDAVAALETAEALPQRPGPPVSQRPGPPPHANANGNGNGPADHAQAHAASIRWGFAELGDSWDSIRWGSIRWGSIRWGSIRWGEHQWDSIRWGSIRWGSIRWGSIRWGGSHWGDETWDWARWGSIRWANGRGWVGEQFDGEVEFDSIRWGSIRWGSIRWASIRWASIRWASVRWG